MCGSPQTGRCQATYVVLMPPTKSVKAPVVTVHDSDPLARYWSKRNFAITSEPRGEHVSTGKSLSFVIQKHAASHLHYDFRLELDGVLPSWAIPKGPSFDPKDKRMAIDGDVPAEWLVWKGLRPFARCLPQ